MNLQTLIDKNGRPDVLIDHFSDSSNKGLAIWGISDFLIFDHNGIKNKNNIYIDKNPLQYLDKTINDWKNDSKDIAAVGYISYDIKNYLYPHITFKHTDSKLPYIYFIKPEKTAYYNIDSFLEFDISPCMHLKQDILDIDSYKSNIDAIKKELLEGNTYQVNFTMEKIYSLEINPFDLYLMIRKISKPEFGFYFNMDKKNILSFSPEQFFYTHSNIIKSYPMKGTRKRDCNQLQDAKLKKELFNSTKDRSEHLMIVDLLRNDLGKISNYGSIKVNDLFNVKSYNTVHQMVSEISGKMVDNIKLSNIIRSLFPGGSITGAPKESTMKIIDRLENYNRGIYTGSIGYIKKNGDMNFNIAIRTMYIDNNLAYYPVGGGIVWDSNYIDEWNEAQLKSKILEQCIIS